MASPRVPALLALEVENRSARPTADRCRNSRTYPQALTRESFMGHATDSSRTPSAWIRGGSINRRQIPNQDAQAFLPNVEDFHLQSCWDIIGIDFFTVPTATFRKLYCFIILLHERRRVVHFNVTDHPTAAWTAQQMIEAFPEDSAPGFLLRDRDSIYGHDFQRRVAGMQIEEVITAPHSPWQNPYAERLIGSIRRECLDHVIVLSEEHL